MTAPRRDPIPFALIAARTLDALPALLARWLPEGRVEADEYVARNPRRADRRAGSFKVNLRSGLWADFASGDAGSDPIDLYAYLNGLELGRAARELESLLGLGEAGRAAALTAAAEAARAERRREDERKREATFRLCARLWKSAARDPAARRFLARYVGARGGRMPEGDVLRLARLRAPYDLTGPLHPVMLTRIADAAGRSIGLHRTYLSADGSAKAELPNVKAMLGAHRGGSARLSDRPHPVLVVTEGIENGLAALRLIPGCRVRAAFSAGNLPDQPIPLGVRKLVIVADADDSGIGIAKAEALRDAARAAGIAARRYVPPAGHDLASLAASGGAQLSEAAAVLRCLTSL